MVDEFLDGNRRFVAGAFAEEAEHYQALAGGQQPTLLWIGCADSRVSETVVTGSRPGQIFVHRNVANIVAFNDNNLTAVLEYGLNHLAISDVVVCGHYGCGGMQALDTGIEDPAIEDWLLFASAALDRVDSMGPMDPAERHRSLVRENVRTQVGHLEMTGAVRRVRADSGRPRIHGWVYDLETGAIEVVVDARD